MKKIISIVSLIFAVLMIASIPVGAYSSYQTYTYDIEGKPLASPDAYTPLDQRIDSAVMGLSTPLNNVNDMIVDDNKNVYIADTGNNRIVVLDPFFKQKIIISSFDNKGIPDSLNAPKGVFPTSERIYVCDTGNARIVVFDLDGNFLFVIPAPESNLFSSTDLYTPVALAVAATQNGDKLFIVSDTTTQGIIVMKETGEFESFIGAQKVNIDFWTWIWRKLQTDEQRKLSQSYIPVEYNNITYTPGSDEGSGYLYVTTAAIDESTVASQINGKTKDGSYLPGIRPGQPTADFFAKILSRVTLLGALFLSVIAILPIIIGSVGGINISLGGTSVLIMVGVALDTVQNLESQMMMRHYKGFLD